MPIAHCSASDFVLTVATGRTDATDAVGPAALRAPSAADGSSGEVMVEDTVRRQTRAIASGDPEALAEFYEEWFDRMYAAAREVTRRDEAFCLDVVQDAVMRIIHHMPEIDNDRALAGWVRRVVLSSAYDRLRAEARSARAHCGQHRNACHAAAAESADAASEIEEQLEWLRGELIRLDGGSARLLMLRHGVGWTLSQIGSAVGLSTGAVDGRIQRAIQKLRRRARRQTDD